jgi:3-oxoacyl-[acyl-carrier protein] reductase
MRLKDQVILITGSARGIGKEIATRFAHEGAIVIISDIDSEMTAATTNEFINKGFTATGIPCDVSNADSVQEMMDKILDIHKRIDILINNAGITRDNLLLKMTDPEWDSVISVNLRGTFICTRSALKPMVKAKKGKIISIASIIGIKGNAGQANYAASKAGIIAFSKSVAKEYGSRGITANAVAPGYIATEMTARLSDKVKEDIQAGIPLKKLGSPRDVAEACLFLASPSADYITGQTIVVDGGMEIN